MGRHEKLTPETVRESLEHSKYPITIQELADEHGVAKSTVRSKIRRLRRESHVPIVHNGSGNFILNSVESEEDAESLRKWMGWLLAIHSGALIIALPIRKLLPHASKILREKLSAEERKELSKSCTRIRALIEQAEVDAEIE